MRCGERSSIRDRIIFKHYSAAVSSKIALTGVKCFAVDIHLLVIQRVNFYKTLLGFNQTGFVPFTR